MRIPASLVLLLALSSLPACQSGAPGTTGSGEAAAKPAADDALKPADSQALATRIVTQSARLRDGDLVMITGGVRDAALLEDLAVQAAAVGAEPLISISSDRLDRMMYDLVPAKYDTVQSKMARGLIGVLTAQISVDVNQDPKILDGVPQERIEARARAGAPLGLLFRKRGIRAVNLGNDLYPTASRASQFGISQADLARIFWQGIDVDYTQLQATGARVRDLLEHGTEVHVTNPNGTDLTARIAGRPAYVSDGVISADDEKRGGAALSVYLPAGEVYVAVVPGSAHGTIVDDHHTFRGKPVEGLRLTVENGKVTGMSATSGLEELKAAYDAAGTGKDLFGVVDIGINPNVKIPQGSRMVGWMPAGMVTLAVGNNTWAGGDNNASFGLSMFIPGSTLTVDGTPLVTDGALQSGQVAAR